MGGLEALGGAVGPDRGTFRDARRFDRIDGGVSASPASAFLVSCSDCGSEIAPGLLACPGCSRLVHAEELARLARAAETAERDGDMTTALGAWRRASELLPKGTLQHTKIDERMRALSAALDGRAAPPSGVKGQGGKKAGAAAGLGAVGLALAKSKALLTLLLANGKLLLVGLLKVPTLISMLVYAHWSAGRGAGLTLGVVACIYVHEVGHVAALRRYGIDASAPMFVPGLGAFVRMKQYPTDVHEEARTGLAGPLWGLVAVTAAVILGKATGSDVALSVASIAGSLNLFNLIPVWELDGARGFRALSRLERLVIGGLALLLGVLLHQWMPAVVGLIALVRAFQGEAHVPGDRRALALFAVGLVGHALAGTLPIGQLGG